MKINANELKEITSHPTLSEVLGRTALSKYEVVASWFVHLYILRCIPYGYVGNAGIKSYIHPHYKRFLNFSCDLDIAIPHISLLEGLRIRKDNLSDGRRRKRKRLDYEYEDVPSPFLVYHVEIEPIQIGFVEYKELDVFTIDTGIGPIPLNEEDLKRRRTIGYLMSLPLEIQLATHINHMAYDDERVTRALFATVSNSCIDYDYVQQKLEEGGERAREVGLLNKSKNGFNEVAKKCEMIERKYQRRIREEDKANIENWRKIIKLLNILSRLL